MAIYVRRATMLKLKNCGKEIARINSNHRMTVDEVIEAIESD